MALLRYAADSFMPLFCSSRAIIVLLNLLNVLGIYCLAYFSSKLLPSRYDVPDLFVPSSQDYFRTSLLGFLSPFLLYFIENFLCDMQSRHVALNLLLQFTLNDWFMLLIIFSLAYPQLQESQTSGSNSDGFNNGSSDTLWQIIPKQCYIFGVSWAFSEVMISIIETLYNYEELPLISDNESNTNLGASAGELQDSIRYEIDLDKCVEIRRNRSAISKNVYDPGYGTFNEINQDQTEDESTMVVNFNNDSMNFLKDMESHTAGYSQQEAQFGPTSYYNGHSQKVKLFPKISSWKDALCKIALSDLILINYTLSMIGQTLIMSIYFIYIPGHPSLFTSTVIYFGSQTFTFYILVLIIPFITLHAIYHVFLYTWKDSVDNTDIAPRPKSLRSNDLHDIPKSPLLFHNHSNNNLSLVPSPAGDNIWAYNSLYPDNDNFSSDDGELLLISRSIVNSWQSLASRSWFIPVGMTIWSLTVFLVGVFATIPI